jgi:hypothetical protein
MQRDGRDVCSHQACGCAIMVRPAPTSTPRRNIATSTRHDVPAGTQLATVSFSLDHCASRTTRMALHACPSTEQHQ